MPCVICNAPIANDGRRKTCSSECSRENARRGQRRKEKERKKRHRLLNPEKYRFKNKLKYALKRAARPLDKRCCLACNKDISHRPGMARYCDDMECRAIRASERKPTRTCRKCGTPILNHRVLCDQCKSMPKPKRNWIMDATTIDEQIRRRAINRTRARKRTRLQRAAYSVYRQLIGEYGNSPPPPPANCLVCGIRLTGGHRKMCGSRSCHAARERISRQLIAEGQRPTSRKQWPKLPTQPCIVCGRQTHSKIGICVKSVPCRRAYQSERERLIANGDWVHGCRFHPVKPRQCIVCGNTLLLPKIRYCQACKKLVRKKRHRQRPSRQRTENEKLAYIAMRELNLLPTRENGP